MNQPSPRTYGIAAVVVLVLVIGGAVLVAGRGSSSSDAAAVPSGADTTSTTGATIGAPPSTAPGGDAPGETTETTTPTTVTAPGSDPIDSGFELPEPEPLPLDVSVSSTTGLSDGDAVSVHVTPHDGSSIFGLEAFICKPDATYLLDADIRPSQTGKCITKPLSGSSNDYVKVGVDPPYESADLDVRVGVGSDTFVTHKGDDVTITCGPGNPCQLVLKLQVPDSYGFQSYPLTFA